MRLAMIVAALALLVGLTGCHYTDYSVGYHDSNTSVHVSKTTYGPPVYAPPPPPGYYHVHPPY